MVDYVTKIIVPYVNSTQKVLGVDSTQAALVIMDNFKGQITDLVNLLLEANNILVCWLPPNTTDLFQLLDIAVNKPVKDFLKQKFYPRYADEVANQLYGFMDIQSAEIQHVNLSFAATKVLSIKWLVEMSEYLAEKPQLIVNGFRKGSISLAFGGKTNKLLDGDEDLEDNEDQDSEDDEDLEDDCIA